MRAVIEVFGARETAAHWREFADRAARPQPFLRAAARILLRSTAERFSRSPWAPLDADTIRHKAKRGQSPQVLRASGTLERALTIWGAPGQELDIGTEELKFGLIPNGSAYYGKFHQRGEGVPKRTILTLSASVRDRLQVAAREFLLGRRV